ncbi:hypothetical protein [Shewanella holmiensis]|uniref:Uncharacterized protein n=1 Tax=Shewanella holmiensis TaxID=2952222 RepID=A0A9X3AQ08_9GAMM|nr:hypothetical protein [Shewanella holmiensis]MCT7942782.1 hypothetical protein [Shewanella holmiensis]
MKLKNNLGRKKLGAVTLCLGAALGMALMVANTAPFIGSMLAVIVVGVYINIVTGKW